MRRTSARCATCNVSARSPELSRPSRSTSGSWRLMKSNANSVTTPTDDEGKLTMTIKLSGNLLRFSNFQNQIEVKAPNVIAGIQQLVETYPDLRKVLLDG